ncbi:MAG: tetratricopeptide repeat protein, partial [bacterium]
LRIFKQGLTEEELSAYKDDFEIQQKMFLDYPDGPESYWALVKIARIKQLVEDYDGANQALFLAANLSPESYLAWANLGNLNFRHYKDFVKAEEYYLNAIKPYSAQVIPYYMDLYEIYRYFYKQETTLAEDILKQGIEKYQGVDRVTDLISTLAYYYRETGRIEQAKEYYQKMLEINPDSQTAKKALSELDDF